MKVIDDDDDEFFLPRFPVAKICCHGYPLQGPVTRARDFDHFKKFARKGKFFEMLSWGGLGGPSPPRNLRYPCLAPVPCPQFTRTIYAYVLRVRVTNGSAQRFLVVSFS